jgi:integrase
MKMASFRQHGKNGKIWYYRYMDASGKQIERKGHWDFKTTQGMARKAEDDVSKIRNGLVNPKDAAYHRHESKPLADHVAEWQAALVAQGFTAKHAEHTSNRVRRLVAVVLRAEVALSDHRKIPPKDRGKFVKQIADSIKSARLSDLNRRKIQDAIARFKDAGWSLQTCNHYRASVKAFTKWCFDEPRTQEDLSHGVTGYNVKKDRRHDRRTISLDELLRLIDATQRGETYQGLSGPIRALCYRTAAATGLRYNELASITPVSFDWKAPSVKIIAAYAKNGETATLTLPDDLIADLATHVATIEPGKPVFPLPKGKGARLIRRDLKAAGIPYRDSAGLVFDFHSLRCELATLADAAGVSPRVVQKMMRHSSLELTGRYTRPRVVDIEAATAMLPSLKPEHVTPETLAATGTDGKHIEEQLSLRFPYKDGRSGVDKASLDQMLARIKGDGTVTPGIDSSLQSKGFDASSLVGVASDVLKAPPGFEPGMKVLQTSALPLGYGARKRSARGNSPGNGS